MRGVYFTLIPFFILFILGFLIFAYDLTIIYFASKELKNLANFVGEVSVKGLVQVKNSARGDKQSALQNLIENSISSHGFFFLKNSSTQPLTVSVSISNNSSNSTSDISIIVGVYTNSRSSRPQLTQFPRSGSQTLICQYDKGCWEPILSWRNIHLANSVKVEVNKTGKLEPFTFVWQLVTSSTGLKASAFSVTRPRVVFNLLDFSPSTFEGQGGFSRTGRWRNLPFYQLKGSVPLESWQACEPKITSQNLLNYSYTSRNQNSSLCEFEGIGELVWNAPKHSMPVNNGYTPSFEMIRSDFRFYRQSDDSNNPDYYVWISWDKRLSNAENPSPATDWLFRNFVFRYNKVNYINSARDAMSYKTVENENVVLRNQTPRLFAHENAIFQSWDLWELRGAIDWEYFDHQYLKPTSYGNYNLSGIYSTPIFQWNANQDYRNFWSNSSPFRGHGNLLAFEVGEGLLPLIQVKRNLLWPVFFMGVLRPGQNLPYHSAHFNLNNRSADSSPFVLRSPDGAIYREHGLPFIGARETCCIVDADNGEVLCANLGRGRVGRLRTRPDNTQVVEDTVEFLYCPFDQKTGSLFYWADTNDWGIFKARQIQRGAQINLCGKNSDAARPCVCGSGVLRVGNDFWIQGCNEFENEFVFWLNHLTVTNRDPLQLSMNENLSFWFDRPRGWWSIPSQSPGSSRLVKIPLLFDLENNLISDYVEAPNFHENFAGKVVMFPKYTTRPPNNDTWSNHSEFFSPLIHYLTKKQCTFQNRKACYFSRAEYSRFFNLVPSNGLLTAQPHPDYLSRAVTFLRYMSDYKPVKVENARPLKHEVVGSQMIIDIDNSQNLDFNLLVEDPSFLRGRRYFNRSLLLHNHEPQEGACPRICESNVTTSPSACPYQLGFHPIVANKLRPNGNSQHNTDDPCFVYRDDNERKGWTYEFDQNTIPTDAALFRWSGWSYNTTDRPIVHIFWPDFYFSNYVGPQPFSDLIQGVAWTYKLLAQDFRIAGDRFGVLPFASRLGFYNSFIPPSEVKVTVNQISNNNCAELSEPQKKLCNFLSSIWPEPVSGQDFHNFNRVQQRYRLGLFPSQAINRLDTNLVWALAAAGLYLKDIAATHRVYLPVFTDLLALGTCRFGGVGSNELTWDSIKRCVENPDNRNLAVQRRDDFRTWFREVMTALTGEDYNSREDYNSNFRRVHQGLIRFLAQNNIIPIFFVLNGTAGGVPITRIGDRCVYDRKELIAKGKPTAFNRTVDGLFFREVGQVLDVAKRSGHYGNAYLYTLGDLEPVLREVGGDFVQLLPLCQVSQESRSNVVARLQGFCSAAFKRNLNPSYPTHYSGGGDNFGICGHLLRYPSGWGAHGWSFSSFPTIAHEFGSCMNFETARGGIGSYWGFSFMNLGLDFGITPVAWRIDRWGDNTYPLNPFLFVGRHANFFLHFMPHIDISVAGGLRCHPERTIFDQIKEVFENILRSPDVIIFSGIPEVSQGLQAAPQVPIPME